MNIEQAFALALQHHQAGRLQDAEALYRQILAVEPNHAEALHYLGVMADQLGRHDLAVERIRQALAINPNNFAAHFNLGKACRSLGRWEEAEAAFRRASQLQPGHPEPHTKLGIALAERGQLEEATSAFHRALQLKPNDPEAHLNLGTALARRGQLDEAVTSYRRALELKPHHPEAHLKLGAALARRNQLDDAMAAYRRALELKPAYPEAHNGLGKALMERGQLDEAVAEYRQALQLNPDDPDAHNNLGLALDRLGQLDEGMAEYRRSLELKPDSAEFHNNLGTALKELGQFDEAVAAYRRALELKPDWPGTYNNLGNVLKDQGLLEEAMAAHRRAIELKPDYSDAHSNLILTTLYHSALDPHALREECRRWEQQHAEPLRSFIQAYGNTPNSSRPLRVGYVSPDFREHPVGRDLMSLFRCHDCQEFEILCYSGVVKPDYLTEAFREYADQWRSTVGVGDDALAAMIRNDGVDILVDLSLHTAGNRLPMFARQPAPMQVSFRGYPGSTGLEAIGYRISDRYLEGGAERMNLRPSIPSTMTGKMEQVLLIDSFWCCDPCGDETEVRAAPALEKGFVTFGCLNNFCKINTPLLKLWARVLNEVKDSRLVLLSREGSHRRRTLEILEREGIEARRVEFVEPRPRRAYLDLYHGVDIALDPFPYNGHSTSLDALWMGVPLVSLAGEHPVSRAGYSQLSNLGLPELVAFSEDEYVGIARQLAGDLPRLAELRRTLRPRMEASPLMDAPRHARQIESAYRTMWRDWCGQIILPEATIPQAFALALQHQRAGRLDDAGALYRQILAVQPNHAEAWHFLGTIAHQTGHHDLAVEQIQRAIVLLPSNPAAHGNLGSALVELGRIEEAIATYHRAIALKPDYAEAHYNLGVALKETGRFDDAIACFRRAIAGRADFADAHLYLGFLLLLLGQHKEGWHEYEWRWRASDYADQLRNFSVPVWDGRPAPGRTLLIHAEQGFGDTLQFARYLPLVRAHSQAARVILECHPALVPLLGQLRDADVDVVATLPKFDLHLPLLSLPRALQIFEPVGMSAPYLQADGALRAQWRARIGSGARRRVGLAWAGATQNVRLRKRHVALNQLLPLLQVDGVDFFNLQIDDGAGQIRQLSGAGRIVNYTQHIKNFADTAAFMAELDLIISVDTAVAHLAGALGRPVWTLLSSAPDWRWGWESETTPWYPTMRLFRQPAEGDWDSVVARVVEELSRAEGVFRQ